VDQKAKDATLAISKAFISCEIEADTAKNAQNDYLLGLLSNDIRFQGGERPWQQVGDKSEAVDFWLMSEMAIQLGLKVDSWQISQAANKCWKRLGVEAPEAAELWMKNHSVSDAQFNKFAIRQALVDASRDWLESVSRGRDFVPICYEYELLTGKGKNSNIE
jgi:hypothetical protein